MIRPRLRPLALALLSALTALSSSPGCGSSGDAGDGGEPAAKAPVDPYADRGPYPVGHAVVAMTDSSRQRPLLVQVWYPAGEAARAKADEGVAIEQLVPEGADRDALAALVAQAPAGCTSRKAHSAEGAEPAPMGTIPVVAFSHCSGCVRFSSLSIAEQLASHGVAVIAPDHTGNTLFDSLAGKKTPLNDEQLGTRALDIGFVLDQALDPGASSLPAQLRGRFDGERVGVFGHSFGGATTGRVLQDDPRPKAGLAIAAPMANPLFKSVAIDKIEKPVFFLLAREDNSITEVGNTFIRDNFQQAKGPAELAEVADAGHWSFSDICGLTESLSPGCGAGTRQTAPGEDFTYIDNDKARRLAGAYVTAFFALHLQGDEGARAYLAQARPEGVVSVKTR